MTVTSRLIFPEDKELDDYSYAAGVETTLVKLLATHMQWKVLDMEYENHGNIRILDNVMNTINEMRSDLRLEFPEFFTEHIKEE